MAVPIGAASRCGIVIANYDDMVNKDRLLTREESNRARAAAGQHPAASNCSGVAGTNAQDAPLTLVILPGRGSNMGIRVWLPVVAWLLVGMAPAAADIVIVVDKAAQ